MGNYEIFTTTWQIITTLFAFFCLFIASLNVLRQPHLGKAVFFLLSALAFDLLAGWIEALAVENSTTSVEILVMNEMVLFLISMFLMAISASSLVFYNSALGLKTYFPALSLGLLGLISIVLFIWVFPDGEIISKLRIILPLTAFGYLAVGLITRLSATHRKGIIFTLLTTLAICTIIGLRFVNIYVPWYSTAIVYIVFALGIMMMRIDELKRDLSRAQKDITNYNQRIEEIIKLSPFPIVISRLGDDKIILANDNALKTFGVKNNDAKNYNLRDFFADSNNRQLLLEQLEEKREVQDFEVLIKPLGDAAPFWLLTSANIIDYNNDVAIYAAFQDITSRKVRENVLQNQAIRDPLTSLYNRRYFETEVAKRIHEAKKSNHAYSILMLDADFFKKVNDTYGHKTGDKVLIELSSKTEQALRDCDIVARYGGEEFLVYLPDITAEQAYKVADRLRLSIASIVVKADNGKSVKFTVSIGITSSEISDKIDVLIKTADEALYKAKQNGRNRVEIFTLADWEKFQKTGGTEFDDEQKTIHPVFAAENNAEISLLDGSDAQNSRD